MQGLDDLNLHFLVNIPAHIFLTEVSPNQCFGKPFSTSQGNPIPDCLPAEAGKLEARALCTW
jgi:hypothetical protein